MKVRIIKEALLSENVDKDYLNSIGIAVGAELGSGQFGTVYNLAVQDHQGQAS